MGKRVNQNKTEEITPLQEKQKEAIFPVPSLIEQHVSITPPSSLAGAVRHSPTTYFNHSPFQTRMP